MKDNTIYIICSRNVSLKTALEGVQSTAMQVCLKMWKVHKCLHLQASHGCKQSINICAVEAGSSPHPHPTPAFCFFSFSINLHPKGHRSVNVLNSVTLH